MKNRNNIITKILLPVGLLALSSIAQAVSPPPDGGYPGGNTGEGQNALLSLSSGTYNTAVGFLSLESNTGGALNTAIGAGALLANVGGQSGSDGVQNTATGAGALLSNTHGGFNTGNGAFALFSNSTGDGNTATGARALQANTIGSGNNAVGNLALFRNVTGSFNTAIGDSALEGNTSGQANVAVGADALTNNNADNNTAVGAGALAANTSGSNNVALGNQAGVNLTTGDNNIDIGNNVTGVAGEADTIRIGNTNITDTFIRGISGTTVASGDPVLVASNGHLGTITSSKRFKRDIKPMEQASEALFALKPVTFRYKKELDPAGTQQLGLVAEDVEKVNPDLVVRDGNGKVNSVRYEQVNAMLLNEFLKAHRKIQEQEATITQLRKEMGALVAHSKEQDSKIQKVSDQIEISIAKPGMVRNDRRR